MEWEPHAGTGEGREVSLAYSRGGQFLIEGWHSQDFGKQSRAALFQDINGGDTGSGMEVRCSRELGVRDWAAGERVQFGREFA